MVFKSLNLQLDPITLIFMNVAMLLAMSMALPLVMGQDLSAAARNIRRSLVLKALAWLSMAVASHWTGGRAEFYLVIAAIFFVGASNWVFFRALEIWLGPRKGGSLLAVLVVLSPLGYAMYFDQLATRAAWAGLMLAFQLFVLAGATLLPADASKIRGNWRFLMLGCWFGLSVLALVRGLMPLVYPGLVAHYREPSLINSLALVFVNIVLVLAGAHHGRGPGRMARRSAGAVAQAD